MGALVGFLGCQKHSATQTATPHVGATTLPPKPPAVSMDNLGTAHPLLIQHVAPDGHWVALCQARQDTDGDGKIEVGRGYHGEMYGDALEPYFVLGGGTGEKLDAFAGADPTGRYVVFGRGGKLVLLDTFAARETDLAGGLVDDGRSPFASQASISFDAKGRRLVYLRLSGRRPEVVVRELASGVERVVSHGPGELWRAQLDEGGEIVWIDVVETDTNDSGTLELPRPKTTLASRRCRGRPSVYGTYGWHGDRPIRRAARRVDGWQAFDADDALGAFGQRLIGRRDHAIVWRDGKEEGTLVPADCKAQLVHADAERERLYFVCRKTAVKNADRSFLAGVERVDAHGERYEVGISLTFYEELGDEWIGRDLSYDNRAHKIFNATTGTVGPSLDSSPAVLVGDRGLYSHPDTDGVARPIVYDISTGERRPFPHVLESRSPDYAVQGEQVAIAVGRANDPASGVVFDMARVATTATFAARPLALAKSGYVLVPVVSGERTSRGDVLMGPVHWIKPTPVSP